MKEQRYKKVKFLRKGYSWSSNFCSLAIADRFLPVQEVRALGSAWVRHLQPANTPIHRDPQHRRHNVAN